MTTLHVWQRHGLLPLVYACHSEPGRRGDRCEESAFLVGADMNHTYFVYILASRSRALYTGVTNNLERRVIQHRTKVVPGFTAQYRTFRLVHFEVFADVRRAISREKEIKTWRREKKVWLINRHNPTWEDLAEPLKQIPSVAPLNAKLNAEIINAKQRRKADSSHRSLRRPGSE